MEALPPQQSQLTSTGGVATLSRALQSCGLAVILTEHISNPHTPNAVLLPEAFSQENKLQFPSLFSYGLC